MIIKKFQARTEQEAVEAARKELGAGVVVMNVKELKRKGLFGLFRPRQVEVTAALEEESEHQPPPRKEREPAAPGNRQTAGAGTDILPEPPTGGTSGEKKDSSVIEEKLDSLHDLLEQQLSRPAEELPEQEEEPTELVKFMKLLYNTMLENEVKEKYANQIIDELDRMNKPNMPLDVALAGVYQKMILKFGQPSCIEPAKKGPKVVYFVGPTGVGKTTTIAKVASRLWVEEKKKVSLITTDTYRIAAAEQLRTYAGIMEVPFRVIYTVEEMQQAVRELIDYDYIMVDTAGHSSRNEELKESMASFLKASDDIAEKEVYLVLSATTKYRDLVKIADSYSRMTEYKLLFTKLDETETLGNLLNLRLYTGAPMSYVTCGQNVPEDIENFNPQKTVKKLLGGKR